MHFRMGHADAAAELVKAFHYSRRPPANIQAVGTWHEDGGLFGDFGDAVAACFVCIPPTRWGEDVWELARLVRTETVRCSLSGLVSATMRRISAGKQMDLIVSFADATQGHHGGVYQACSWEYDGQRERNMDGLIVDGTFIPGRSCNSMWGTRSPTRLAERFPDKDIKPHYDDGKHLYWKALNKAGRAKAVRLGLRSKAYPKPDAPKPVQEAML